MFMSDLQQLEEEAVLQEGEALMQQRQQERQHGGSSWKRSRSADKSSSSAHGGVSITEPYQQQSPFNFASYVARFPLAAALQLLQQHYHQPTPTALPALQQQQQQQQQGVADYQLGVSGGDVRACLALRGRDAFVDLEDMGSSSSNWQLGVYELSSTEEEEQLVDVKDDSSSVSSVEAVAGSQSGDGMQDHAATAAGIDAATVGSSSSSSRQGRWRWGKGSSSSSTATAQDSSNADSSHKDQPDLASASSSNSSSSRQALRKIEQQQAEGDLGSAAYKPLALPSSSNSSSSSSSAKDGGNSSSRSRRGRKGSSSSSSAAAAAAPAAQVSVPLRQMLHEQQDADSYGDVSVQLSSADVGTCDKTPVFQIPGLHFVLDTTYGEVSFSPTFMSLAHLVSFLDAAKTAATKLWIKERRARRLRWRQGIEASALALAAQAARSPGSLLSGSSGGFAGGRGSSSAAAAAAAQEESDEDEDGMGDPPEAKALLEELGESPGVPQRGSAALNINSSGFGGSGVGSFTVPSGKGVLGALNAVALGTISMAAAGCCGAQELLDRAALAVPAVGEWVIGLPGSVNVRAAFLEDLAAAAAEHNRRRLQPPYTVIAPAASSSSSSSGGSSSSEGSAHGAAAAAGVSAGGAAAGLYDPLGLVSEESTHAGDQQQQQQLAPLPPMELPCLEGLRLLLQAGWAVAADVLLRDGELAGAMLGGPESLARRLQGATRIQVGLDCIWELCAVMMLVVRRASGRVDEGYLHCQLDLQPVADKCVGAGIKVYLERGYWVWCWCGAGEQVCCFLQRSMHTVGLCCTFLQYHKQSASRDVDAYALNQCLSVFLVLLLLLLLFCRCQMRVKWHCRSSQRFVDAQAFDPCLSVCLPACLPVAAAAAAILQVSDEGEVALRLGLTVMAAPVPYNSISSRGLITASQLQQLQLQPPQQHTFELGVHLNLSQLMGVPSLQHADQLHVDRAGTGRAAHGVLLIGDLALDVESLPEMAFRAPSLGLGVLPVAPLLDSTVQQQQQEEGGEEAGSTAAGKGRSRRSRGGRAAGGSSSSSP
jgi:hypothetical protein